MHNELPQENAKDSVEKEDIVIPDSFTDEERILRGLYSPKFFTKANALKSNAFQLRPELDKGVSVLRLDFSDTDTCKRICKSIEKPEVDKTYVGLALLVVRAVLAASIPPNNTRLVSIPEEGIPHHAEIYYYLNGVHFVCPKGQQHPKEIIFMMDKLRGAAIVYHDNNPNGEGWGGPDLREVNI